MRVDEWNLVVSVLVLIGTAMTVWFARTRRPHFRFDHMQIRPNFEGRKPVTNVRWYVSLVFINDGPGVAQAANAYATGALDEDWPEPEIRYPHDGSPTLRVGESMAVEGTFFPIPMPEGFHRRRYFRGDDYYFDLRDLTVRFEWGKKRWWRFGRRPSQTLRNLHRQQQDASPQFDKDWPPRA